MVSDAAVHGLKERFRSIALAAKEVNQRTLLQSIRQEGDLNRLVGELDIQVPGLVESYLSAREEFHSGIKDMKLENVEVGTLHWGASDLVQLKKAVVKLIINCESAVGYLERVGSPIPKEVIDRLEAQRGQIVPVEVFDINLFKHLSKAIDEHESGHYLAAAMVAGKAATYINGRLDGTSEEEKVENLIRKGLVDPKLKESFLRASRKTRNFYSHDLSAVPEPQEALSAVSDAVDLAIKYWKSTTV
jgi:hypothetical protein